MRVLSLFSGGGLGDYGLELAGMTIVGQVEIDDYCQKILQLRWPRVPKWRDIRTVTRTDLLRTCGSIDLISGGFPCQPFSLAGKRKGVADDRNLWPEFARLIRELRPRWVLAENVPGLLSMDAGRVFGTILGDLAASGYRVEWDCLPASAVGAPHRRDRVWIVAYAISDQYRRTQQRRTRTKKVLPERHRTKNRSTRKSSRASKIRTANHQYVAWSNDRHEDTPDDTNANGQPLPPNANEREIDRRQKPTVGHEHRPICEPMANAVSDAAGTTQQPGTHRQPDEEPHNGNIFRNDLGNGCGALGRFWAVEPNVGRVAHGTPNRVDRLKLLGNGQVVQMVEWIGRQIMHADAVTP